MRNEMMDLRQHNIHHIDNSTTNKQMSMSPANTFYENNGNNTQQTQMNHSTPGQDISHQIKFKKKLIPPMVGASGIERNNGPTTTTTTGTTTTTTPWGIDSESVSDSSSHHSGNNTAVVC
jgi:hypothetical protein